MSGVNNITGDSGVIESKTQNMTAVDGTTTFTEFVQVGDLSTTTVGFHLEQDDATWTLNSDYTEGGRPFKLSRVGLGDVVTASSTGSIAFPQVVGGVGQFLAVDGSGNLSAANPSGTITGSDVEVLNAGGTGNTTVQNLQDIFHSSGHVSGGVCTDNGDGTVAVTAGEGLLRNADSSVAPLYFVAWPLSSSVALTNSNLNYVYVEWNGGTPQVAASTSVPNNNTQFCLATVYRDGTELHITDGAVHAVGDHANLMISRMKALNYIQRESNGGAIVTEVGTRNIAITAGNFWIGLNGFSTSAFDSSVADTFKYYYDVLDYKASSPTTQIDNAQYDNAGTLATLSNNNYGVHFVYLGAGDSDVSVIYGTSSYSSLSDAEAAPAPGTVPGFFDKYSVLIAKIIIKKNDASFTDIVSSFTDPITAGTAGVNQVNGIGTDNSIARFDSNGNTIQDSEIQIDDNGHIYPTTTSIQDVGTDSLKFRSIYALTKLQVGTEGSTWTNYFGDQTEYTDGGVSCKVGCNGSNGYFDVDTGALIDLTANNSSLMTFGETANTSYQDIVPNTTGGHDLGTSSLKWNDIHLSGALVSDESLAFDMTQGGSGTIVVDDNTTTRASLTSGSNAIIIGRFAGTLTNASDSVFIGVEAARYNTGTSNTAVGRIALGGHATNPSTAINCTAVGYLALRINETGNDNTAIGYATLDALTTGTHNTAVGRGAGGAIIGGSNNVCIGKNAGLAITSGGNTTCVGPETNATATSDNSTAIGNGATCTADDEIVLGNSSITSFKCQVALTVVSDERDKTEVKPLDAGLSFIQNVEPCTWKWNVRKREGEDELKSEQEPTYSSGFTAQQLKQVMETYGDIPGLVNENDPERLGVAETRLIPVLVKAVQTLKSQLDELTSVQTVSQQAELSYWTE